MLNRKLRNRLYAWAGWFAAWAGDYEIERLSQSNFKIARGQLDR